VWHVKASEQDTGACNTTYNRHSDFLVRITRWGVLSGSALVPAFVVRRAGFLCMADRPPGRAAYANLLVSDWRYQEN